MSVIVVGHHLCGKSSFIRSVSGRDAVTDGIVTHVTNELSLAEVSSEINVRMFTSWTNGRLTDRMITGWLTLPMNRRITGVIVLCDATKPESVLYACEIIQRLTRDVYNPTPFVLISTHADKIQGALTDLNTRRYVSCMDDNRETLDWVMRKLRQ